MQTKTIYAIIWIAILCSGCNNSQIIESLQDSSSNTNIDTTVVQGRFIPGNEHFEFPLGYPDLTGYHDAKPFGKDNHLGADLNKDGNGDNDLGDTIYSIGNGVVTLSSNALLNVMHRTSDPKYPVIKAVYFHCSKLLVEYDEIVKAGQPVALVGKESTTFAHLHFEIVTDTNIVAGFYSSNSYGFIDPVKFINEHR